jgi:hypothetical protein
MPAKIIRQIKGLRTILWVTDIMKREWEMSWKEGVMLVFVFVMLSGCAETRYNWIRPNTTSSDRTTALSECRYQIKLNKTESAKQNELLALCMQGKGFRWRAVN